MTAAAASPRVSPVLVVVLLVALAIGAAASLIAGAATAPAFHSGPDSEVIIPVWGLEAAFLAVFGAVVGVLLWIRLGASTAAIGGRMVVTTLLILLVGVLFVVVLQVVGGAGGGFLLGGGGNTTTGGGGSSPPSNGSGGLIGPGGTLVNLHAPAWTLFAVVAAVALVVGAVAVPRALGAWKHREHDGRSRAPRPAEVEEMHAALVTAARALEQGSGPRDVVIALYGTVLARVAPIVGGVDVDTPEEIRVLHLVRLGIRASAAETLTRLFEEARYSTHPMGPEAAGRAREAIAQALEDLERLPPPS